MTYMIQTVIKQIEETVSIALNKTIESGQLPAFDIPKIAIEKPREEGYGDFSCNIAMISAKHAKMAPVKIANIIRSEINTEKTLIDKVEVAGPGFLNFFINEEWLRASLEQILKQGEDFGKLDFGKGKKVMVEFVSANPTGPLHMGNARGGALGDLIAEVFEKSGHEVVREYYVNDAGNQIDKFAQSLELRYLQELKGEDYVEFPEDCYQGQDIIDHVRDYIESGMEELIKKDCEYRKQKLVEYALPKNIENIKAGLSRYGIKFDNWFSERSLYDSGEVDETIEYLKQNGHTKEREGALWLKGESIGAEKDEVLIKSDGFKTYFAADLAYHRNKFKKREFDMVINLLGTDHHAHAQRMRDSMPVLGVKKEKLDLVLFQLVRLIKGGETVRMSKRTGRAISLDDLLDEVGVDAARFFFNMKASGSHLDFDLDLAVKQTNENPVFYVQYAHARICSMLRILEQEGVDIRCVKCPEPGVLTLSEEKHLMKILAEYPEEISISVHTLEPSRLTRYAVELASAFHSFYNACRVKGEEKELMKGRLALVKATLYVLKNVLGVLKINAPEKM